MPMKPATASDWQRRLDDFAVRVAHETLAAGVPLHFDDGQQRQYPFWIVAGDVYQGVRWPYWTKHLAVRPEIPLDEHMRAHLLLLTRTGQLIRTDSFFGPYEAGPTGNDATSAWSVFERESWAWQNVGSWREIGMRRGGFREEWRPSYRRSRRTDPGYGTSAALSAFRRAYSTQWPARFDVSATFEIFRSHRAAVR